MIVTLKLSDETYDAYGKMHQSPQRAMEIQLERFKKVPSHDRAAILSGSTRQRVEKVYEKTLEDGEQFATWLERLKSINVEGVNVALDAGTMKRLKTQADARRMDLPSYVSQRVKEVLENML
jgi:hypothetical protein